ncbi:hypothetical protein DZF91_09060 [Actinomadura logoneensis]|uniref:Lipoprotein n=1 Tax=Actinomadura logoneensis TaxID=2293572 RepID=A0A372JQB7_9ACTN|nr:hypothetical protein DZF91_09060 [Actinomadura logoneensis]
MKAILVGATAVLTGAALLTGCGTQTKVEGVRDYPATATPPIGQGGDGLVLRWRMTGGMAGRGGPWTVPDFSLYADGTAIVPGKGPEARLQRYHLKQPVFQQLVAEARKAGLERSRRIGSDARIADAMVLRIWMGSAQTDVVMPEQHNVPATAVWKKLQPEQWPAGDQQSPPDVYQPERIAVSAFPSGDRPAPSGTVAWPLSPLGAGTKLPQGSFCTVYGGADAARVRKLAAKTPLGASFSSGGQVYSVQIRPLLPDEKSCTALG